MPSWWGLPDAYRPDKGESTWAGLRPHAVEPAVAAGLNAIGRLIFDARREAGFSQRELAARSDVNQSTISRLENGVLRTIRFLTLARIFGVLYDVRQSRWSRRR